MTNFYVGLMLITATTVGKIILSSSAGMVVSRYFDHPDSSIKGLSFIAMRVSLPCLLFTNLCFTVTWEQLSKFYWAPLFGCVPMILGFLSSFVVRRFLTKEYRYVVILASTFQNALSFPVSILLNLKGIEWFTGKAVEDAQSYAFLYNLICNIGLYSIGEPLIAWAKQKDVDEEEAMKEAAEAEERRQQLIDMGATPNEVATFENRSFAYPFESPRRASAREETLPGTESPTAAMSPVTATAAAAARRDATAQEQLGWYRQAGQKDRPIMPPPGSPVIVLGDEPFGSDTASITPGKEDSLQHFRKNVIESLTGGPNLASFVAIFVALVPPLRWLAKSFVGEALIGGMKLIGEGAIPLQLLVLGCTLVGPPTVAPAAGAVANAGSPSGATTAASPTVAADPDGAVLDVSAEAPGPGEGATGCLGFLSSLASPQVIFTWCTVFLRLVILPAACFLLLHILVSAGLMPRERPFILAMLTEALSPSAMNSSLICAIYGYHAKNYSRMIFCQYIACIFTTTIWLFIFVLYIERTI